VGICQAKVASGGRRGCQGGFSYQLVYKRDMKMWLKKKRDEPSLEEQRQEALKKCYPYCQKCGESVEPDEKGITERKYCPDCGSGLIQPKICEFCGNVIWARSVYCMGCGVKVVRQ
jgi:hypothetical protein